MEPPLPGPAGNEGCACWRHLQPVQGASRGSWKPWRDFSWSPAQPDPPGRGQSAGSCPPVLLSPSRATRAPGRRQTLRTQNATGGEIQKNSKGKKKGKRLDGEKRNRKAHDGQKRTRGAEKAVCEPGLQGQGPGAALSRKGSRAGLQGTGKPSRTC